MTPSSLLLNSIILLFGCASQAFGAALPASPDYDVLIIGGGPSGLQAASSLGRVQRNAIMLDSGDYRNAPTRHAHDILGFDGTAPAAFRYLARQQVSKYPTVSMTNATIVSIENVENGTMFIATDSTGRTFSGKKLVLASGVRDILPTEFIAEAWGKGIYWCPWCDGYEHRGQSLGVLGNFSVSMVKKGFTMQSLNKDIILFANGTATEDDLAAVTQALPKWQSQLQQLGVVVDNRTIASLQRLNNSDDIDPAGTDTEHDLFLVVFSDGSSVQRNAFVTLFPDVQRSDLGSSMGVQIDKSNKMIVDISSMQTNVAGIYAIGDANNDGSTNVPHAMFSAKRAIVHLHDALSSQEVALLPANPRRSIEEDIDELWKKDLEELWDRVQRH